MSKWTSERAKRLELIHHEAFQKYHDGASGDAVPLFRELLEICCDLHGDEHPTVAKYMVNLAVVLSDLKQYAEAETLLRDALAVRRRCLGEQHLDVARSLHALAGILDHKEEFVESEQLFRQAVAIRCRHLGDQHLDVADSLCGLADVLCGIGNYAEAEHFLRQALATRRRLLGDEDAAVGIALHKLAHALHNKGAHGEAEQLLRESISLENQKDGEGMAASLHLLAQVLRDQGDYAGAVSFSRKALETCRDAVGDEQETVAHCKSGLALDLARYGDYVEAEQLLREAMTTLRARLGADHSSVGFILNHLGIVLENAGKFEEAVEVHRSALSILRQVYGEGHQHTTDSMNGLSCALCAKGDYPGAEVLLRRIVDARRPQDREAGTEAQALNNLAYVLHCKGEHAEAERLYRQALGALERVFLGDHPNAARTLTSLAGLCAATDRPSEAMALMQRASVIIDNSVAELMCVSSEREREDLALQQFIDTCIFLSVATHLKDAGKAALDVILRRKGVALEVLSTQRDAVLTAACPHLAGALAELSAIRARIAAGQLSGPGPEGMVQHQRLLKEWRQQRDQLERHLAAQLPEMRLTSRLSAADHQAVARSLPSGSVLLEFVRFSVFDSRAFPAQERLWKEDRYLVFVLRSHDVETVDMIDLGAAEPIDRLIADVRLEILDQKEETAPRSEAAAALRTKLVPDAVEKAISGATRLFVSPDGELNRLPFEALPGREHAHLMDELEISYVGSGRDILRFGQQEGATGPAIVAADPDYSWHLNRDTSSARDSNGSSAPKEGRSLDWGQLRCKRLPMSRLEGIAVAARLRQAGLEVADPWFDENVLDARLKNVSSPHILHIATHGVCLEDQHRDFDKWSSSAMLRSGSLGRIMPSWPRSENPLLRSMLLLAGVNAFATGTLDASTHPAVEDGLLTAEDVCSMNLWGTELVVVSACDTGLGAVRYGEGVYGLRRSFIQAGARALVMSLWKVPDLATSILMDRFYRNLVECRMDKPGALREAQRYLRSITIGELQRTWLSPTAIECAPEACRPELSTLAQQHRDNRPFEQVLCWGAFICQGDPSPITNPSIG